MSNSPATQAMIKFRTEDGCEVAHPPSRVVNRAYSWAPNRVTKVPAERVELGDVIDTPLGISRVVEVLL